MKKQNLVRPSSSDQFLKKGGFKVFHFDKSNISSIGKLINAPKKIIKKYPPLPEFNQQQLKSSSSFSFSFQELSLQPKTIQKNDGQKNEFKIVNRKLIQRPNPIPTEIQFKIKEIIRMNSLPKKEQASQGNLFRQRIQNCISSMKNIGSLPNNNQSNQPNQKEEAENNNTNKRNVLLKRNGQKSRQRSIQVHTLKNTKTQKKIQRQPSSNNNNIFKKEKIEEQQVCERITRNKLRSGSLDQQSFFQLEIKAKFSKDLSGSNQSIDQIKAKTKIETPNQKKKIKKLKKQEPLQEVLYSSKYDKKQKQAFEAVLLNSLPPRNPTIKHEYNCLQSDQVVLTTFIKQNKLYFASQFLQYNKKAKSLIIRCSPRYFSFVTQTLKSSQNCKSIPEVPAQSEIKKIKLKRKFEYTNKKTLVLDLDQTLIHSQGLNQKANKEIFPFSFDFDKTTRHYTVRNYAKQFVRNLSQKFYIVVFTSAVQGYADNILQHIDPQQKYIHHRLYRSNCYLYGQKYPYIKDLRILNRDLSQIIIVDNSLYAFWFNIDNGVPIVSFTGIQDEELRKLQKYLLLLQNVDDVRKVNRRAFHLHLYRDHVSSKDLLNDYCKLVNQQALSNEPKVIEI